MQTVGFIYLFIYLSGGFMLAKQTLCCLSHTSSPFCSGYFGDGVSQIICQGWP
jgi:hypothetical protein